MQQKKIVQSNDKTYPAILKRERTLRGWSQADVATRIGSDPKTIGRWERGLTAPGPYLCQRLSEVYGKTVQELGLIADDQPSSPEGEKSSENDTSAALLINPTANYQTISQTPVKPTLGFASLARRGKAIVRLDSKWQLLFLCVAIVFLLTSAGGMWWWHLTITNIAENPYSGQGKQALNDSLQTNTAAGWSLNNNDEGACFFADGAYRIRVIKTGGYMKLCVAAETYFTDFTYEAKMQVVAGNCGGLGFRTTFPQLYYFVICQDGHYRFVRYSKGQGSNKQIIQGVSLAIQQGLKSVNVLAVVAVGDTFKLYVNHQLLYQGTDGAYLDGQIGLLAHSCRITYPDKRPDVCSVPSEVVFSDARIWT